MCSRYATVGCLFGFPVKENPQELRRPRLSFFRFDCQTASTPQAGSLTETRKRRQKYRRPLSRAILRHPVGEETTPNAAQRVRRSRWTGYRRRDFPCQPAVFKIFEILWRA